MVRKFPDHSENCPGNTWKLRSLPSSPATYFLTASMERGRGRSGTQGGARGGCPECCAGTAARGDARAGRHCALSRICARWTVCAACGGKYSAFTLAREITQTSASQCTCAGAILDPEISVPETFASGACSLPPWRRANRALPSTHPHQLTPLVARQGGGGAGAVGAAAAAAAA